MLAGRRALMLAVLRSDQREKAMQRYRIVVRGVLSQRLAALFEGMTLETAGENTALVGPVRDQSQLQGLLARVGDVGVELMSLDEVGDPRAARVSAHGGPPACGRRLRACGRSRGCGYGRCDAR